MHKRIYITLLKTNNSDRLSKIDIFLKKAIDFLIWICYNRKAVRGHGKKIRSLKIEQYEISSTEKCEISLKNTLKKETQKSKKSQEKIFLKNDY